MRETYWSTTCGLYNAINEGGYCVCKLQSSDLVWTASVNELSQK